MINYYGVTHCEYNGKLLFVLKLDECQVVKGQWVSLRMMSRALLGKELEEDNSSSNHRCKLEYFGV